EQYGIFLSEIFDRWSADDIGRIEIQIFEEATRRAFGREHSLCIFRVDCGGVPVVEHNGDFYSCDHYVDEDHFLGNISEGSLAGFLDSERQHAFGRAKSLTLPGYCRECDFLDMCNGECPRNRFISTPGGEPGLNYLCEGYKIFFAHCQPFIEALRELF
ncbi:MAG: SPASM domain-containing protein, partial [Bacteroidales bacterium]|nr:SPASM domain-containing protein [Bacteroidales bacterium]